MNNLKSIAEEDGVEKEGYNCDVDTDHVDEEEKNVEEDDNDDTGKKKDNEANESNNCASQQSNKKKTSATNRNESNKLHELTQNVCIFYLF